MAQNGIKLRLGVPLKRGQEAETLGIEGETLVLGCAGVGMRCSFVAPFGCLDDRGAIRVNAAMQVVTDSPSAEDVRQLGHARASVAGAGRIFAIGDCVSLQGADPPLSKECYPAEAMADVVVYNLRMAKTVQCLRSCPGILKELSPPFWMNHIICSLGPDDAVYVLNGGVVSTGWIATNIKHQIESTKMGQLKGCWVGSLVWYLIPHW